MSSPKKIKNFRLIELMRELKHLEDAIEEINKIDELGADLTVQSTERKISAI